MSLTARRVLFSSVIYLAIIAAAIILIIRPLFSQVQSKQIDLQNAIQQYATAQQKLQQLTLLNEQRDQITAAKDVALRAVPATLDQDRLILSLEHVASDAKLSVKSISTAKDTGAPNTAAKSSALASLQTTMVVRGPYNAVTQFLDTIEKLDRVIAINTVTLAKPTSNASDLEATVVISSFAGGSAL